LQRSILAKRAWLVLFIVITAFYLWGLGSLPLVGPDEPRYAQVAREMLMRRDFITPTLGGLPWFEKPPLLYWMMMLAYRVLGVSEYAARIGSALCGLATAVFIYWMGRAISDLAQERDLDVAPNIGRWSALAWLSSLGAIGFSRGATFDIVLTMTISGALACFFVSEAKARRGRDSFASVNWLLAAFYLFAGLSLLAKGLIGFVIIFGVVGSYFILRREWPRRPLLLSLAWGVPASVLLASIWYGPMIARHGWTFIDQFIIQHHFARFVSNKFHHPEPFYFYLPVLIVLALPWTILLGAGLISSRRWDWRGESALDRARVFAFAWLLLPLVFFSFSGSKLGGYILPALPGVALLVGERIACFISSQRGEKVLRLTGILLIVMVAAAIWYTHRHSDLKLLTTVLVALPLIVTGMLAVARTQLRRHLFVAIVIAVLLTAAIGVRLGGAAVARTDSVRDLIQAATARGYSNLRVVQLHDIERGAEFYAAGRIEYGSDGEPIKFEGVAQVLDAARRNGGAVLCLIPIEYSAQLINYQPANAELIFDNGRLALVVVRAK
jgi:4-amino-4-deoxy-L-arabinose transferase-like glycosyltransferase